MKIYFFNIKMLIVILLIILIFIVSYKFGGQAEISPSDASLQQFYMGEVWYRNAKNGSKIADLRPGPLSKYVGFTNQTVIFKSKTEYTKAKIIHVNHYNDWNEMNQNDYKFIAPHLKSMADLAKAMLEYYDIRDTEGICVLFFEMEGVRPSTPEAESALAGAKKVTPYETSHADKKEVEKADTKKADAKKADTKKADAKKADKKNDKKKDKTKK